MKNSREQTNPSAQIFSEFPLGQTAQYLVHATQTTAIKPESRESQLPYVVKLLGVLHAPIGLTVALAALRLALKSAPIELVGNAVVEDHASGTIHATLNRIGIDAPFTKSRVNIYSIAKAIWLSWSDLSQAYASVDLTIPFDRKRVLRLLSFYVFWKAYFLQRKPSASYIVQTNDQRRLALGVVSQEFDVPLIAWTIGRNGTRPRVPFSIAAQLCWSKSQKQYLESLGVQAYQMPVEKRALKAIDPDALKNNALGLLLNARVDLGKLKSFLTVLKTTHGIQTIQARPHPGSRLNAEDLNGFATLRDWREPLPHFLDSINAAVCMSSSSIYDALFRGVPVAYQHGLDDFEQDLTGLVQAGVIPQLNAATSPVETLVAHYTNNAGRSGYPADEYIDDGRYEKEVLQRYAP